jgi:hypothetical protein
VSKAEIKEWQITLQGAGFPPGAIDGDFGPATLKASMASIKDQLPAPAEPEDITELPSTWLPYSSKMRRIIAHWTAGSNNVSRTDKEHYHFIWDGSGQPHRGDRPVTANESTADNDGYAAHTKNCNSGSIGVSVACMAGAKESPFDPGLYPMTKAQWDGMCKGIAQLCNFYKIPVTDSTVLSHAEVEGTLHIDQNGKWDFTRLPWALDVKGAHACGERMRDDVTGYL